MKQYPLIRTDAKTTISVYSDTLQLLVDEVNGETNADRFNTAVKFWFDNKNVNQVEFLDRKLWEMFKPKVKEMIKNGG